MNLINLLGIIQLLHEACVLTHTRNVEGLYLRADRKDEIVIRHTRRRYQTLNLRCVCRKLESVCVSGIVLARSSNDQLTCELDSLVDRL